MPHNPLGPLCTAAAVHLAAAVPNVSWLEIRESPTEHVDRYDKAVYPVQPVADGPNILVPDAPGLGVEVDESLLRPPSDSTREFSLRRRDGSVTNW